MAKPRWIDRPAFSTPKQNWATARTTPIRFVIIIVKRLFGFVCVVNVKIEEKRIKQLTGDQLKLINGLEKLKLEQRHLVELDSYNITYSMGSAIEYCLNK